MKKQLEDYFTKRYGGVSDELRVAMDLADLTVSDFDKALAEVRWIFCCEWDCGSDEWHKEYYSE